MALVVADVVGVVVVSVVVAVVVGVDVVVGVVVRVVVTLVVGVVEKSLPAITLIGVIVPTSPENVNPPSAPAAPSIRLNGAPLKA